MTEHSSICLSTHTYPTGSVSWRTLTNTGDVGVCTRLSTCSSTLGEEDRASRDGRACVLSSLRQVWLFVTLWTIVHQAPLSMGFSRQECWSGLPCLPAGDLPHPGIKPRSPAVPALQADPLLLSHQGSPHRMDMQAIILSSSYM